MSMVTMELLAAAVTAVLLALLVCVTSATRRRRGPQSSITEAQARENAAPLTTAILASGRVERTEP